MRQSSVIKAIAFFGTQRWKLVPYKGDKWAVMFAKEEKRIVSQGDTPEEALVEAWRLNS